MTLDETRFATLADATLRRLLEAIDEAGADSLETDLRDGILTIDLESGGHYVVNKHAPIGKSGCRRRHRALGTSPSTKDNGNGVTHVREGKLSR